MTELRAIDIHCHIVPERFPPYAGKGKDVLWPSMSPAHACHAHVMIQGKVYRTVHQSCWLAQDRIDDMDRHSIRVQCLSPMPELLSYWLPLADSQAMIRFLNDEIAQMVARFPKRFVGLGAVPLQDMDAALRELDYVLDDLKFPGIEIASHVNGVSIGDPRFAPFFAAVERKGAAVFVHALRPAGQDRIVGGVAEQVICFPGDIGLAAASMLTGGIAERHPNLRIAFSHGGGVFSILIPRMTHAWNQMPKLKEAMPQSPGVYARRFYYDTIVFDPAALGHIIHTFGASQIVVGTDFPFAMGDPDPLASIGAAGLDAATVRAITCENAERFLGRRLAGN